jgi:hypothetical protein
MGIDFDIIKNNIKKNSYRMIGKGSGRVVFDLENGYVVKAARNYKGIAQNKTEFRIASTNHSGFLAKIIAISDDYQFLIMVKAERIHSIEQVWKHLNVRSNRELFGIKELNELVVKNDLLIADLYRPYSWGMVDGKPVIVDYGFTREVRRKYYPRFF